MRNNDKTTLPALAGSFSEMNVNRAYVYRIWNDVFAGVRASVWDSVRDSVRDDVGDSVWASVRGSIEAYS
jgi:hypothetical protein